VGGDESSWFNYRIQLRGVIAKRVGGRDQKKGSCSEVLTQIYKEIFVLLKNFLGHFCLFVGLWGGGGRERESRVCVLFPFISLMYQEIIVTIFFKGQNHG